MSTREEFEKWGVECFNYGFNPDTWDERIGGYLHEETQMCWEGWQAAMRMAKSSPLTDDELDALAMDDDGLPNTHLEFARAIEARHGIKEAK